MEPYDLEIGPIQRAFENLFRSISIYFNSNDVEPRGPIRERGLSYHSQQNLRKTLRESLEYYGCPDLPMSLRVVVGGDSVIDGVHRSDDIVVYDEKLNDGSHRIFNFYQNKGPENMKMSYYWLDMSKEGQQIQGILTNDNRWYLRITTPQNKVYYLRMERSSTDL